MQPHTSSALLPSSTVSKKLEEKQERRLAEERRRQEHHKAARKRNLFTLIVIALVAALVVWLILSERNKQNPENVGVDPTTAGCTEIQEHPDEGQDHVDTDVTYGTQPPSSGNHFGQTADIGFHTADSGFIEENAVHNLEHGQIVAWYNPAAPQAVLDDLEISVDDAGIGMLAMPYEQVPSGYNFSLSAWGATQSCEEVSGEVICAFREAYQGKGPEQVGIPTADC